MAPSEKFWHNRSKWKMQKTLNRGEEGIALNW